MKVFNASTFALVLSVFLGGCVTQPTVVRERPERKMESAEQILAPIKIDKDTVVVDARPRFEYSLAHIPRSVSLQWSDFTEAEKSQRGVLQGDLFAAARRLARFGISPESQIVVVGRGRDGDGEEGRVAWMLAYMGVTRVQFAAINSFRVNMTNVVDEDLLKSAPIWKPEPIESLNVSRAEVLGAINNRAAETPYAFSNGSSPAIYRLIDVRSAKNYLGREGLGQRRHVPNMDTVNVPWREFFDPSMRPLRSISSRLQEIGVRPEHRVIVLDEDGVASAAVTLALRGLGFDKAGNYAGGLIDLLENAP